MKIEKDYINDKFFDEKREISEIKYIVIKDIINSSATHYIIINGKAIQKIPDKYTSKAVNGGKLNRFGFLHGICTKYNSISIGIQDRLSDEDKEMCLKLVMTLKQRYNIKNDNVVRQMDITGKCEPKAWHNFDIWNAELKEKLIDL